jgi:phosphatidylinositol-3-phosphatase
LIPHRILSVVVCAALATVPARAQLTSVKTVFIIVLENHNWSRIKGAADAPYINKTLLPQASHAEQDYNPPGIHPSLPNYLWLEAGTNFGITNDDDPSANHQSSAAHLVAQLETAGISWKTYQEDISGTICPLSGVNRYAPKHNPFVYFDDVTNTNDSGSSYCIAHVRPFTELAGDLQNNTVANYVFITPNLCDDGHDSCAPVKDAVRQTDNWLAANVPAILNSTAYKSGGALFITWDEAEGSDGPIGLILLSPYAKGGGYSNTVHYTHGSLLHTVEEIFAVSLLGDAAVQTDLSDLFASTRLSATAGNLEVTLNWNAIPDALGYNLKRGTTSGGPYDTVVASGISATTYIDADVSNGTTYYYVVTGVNSGAEGSNSNEASATPSAVTAPVIASVVNGASFLPGIQENCWVTIAGSNLSTTTRTWKAHTEIVNGKLPTSLDGVSVSIDGKPASMYYISPGQIDVLAPGDSNLGPVEVKVTIANGTSSSAVAQLQKYSPAFFKFGEQGGKYIAALIALAGGKVDYLGPVGLFGSTRASRPAKPGEVILLYGTGFGPTNPAVPSGMVFSGAAKLTDKIAVTIGGVPAKVQFAGVTGVGLYQLNVVVPPLPDGDQKVIATIGGLASQDNSFIAVKN